MSLNILKYNQSVESKEHENAQVSQFAGAQFAQCSNQSIWYETVEPETAQTAFGTTVKYFPYKPEAVISNLQLRIVLGTLSSSATLGTGQYLRWRRWAAHNGLETVKFVFGNESSETFPGWWIHLQNQFYEDKDRRQYEEILDLTGLERDTLSGPTIDIDLKPFFLRHRGTYLPCHAIREQFRVEATFRSAEHWYETNTNTSTFAVTANMASTQLLVEYTSLPPAELASYVKQPWRIPMKTLGYVESEAISGTSHIHVINEPGFIEGYFVSFRSSDSAGSTSNEYGYDYLTGDEIDDATFTLKFNNQPAFDNVSARYFRQTTPRKYLPMRPDDSDGCWYYIPFALDSSMVAATGGSDHNTPQRVTLEITFASSFTGNMNMAYAKRNVFSIRSGKAQKRYG